MFFICFVLFCFCFRLFVLECSDFLSLGSLVLTFYFAFFKKTFLSLSSLSLLSLSLSLIRSCTLYGHSLSCSYLPLVCALQWLETLSETWKLSTRWQPGQQPQRTSNLHLPLCSQLPQCSPTWRKLRGCLQLCLAAEAVAMVVVRFRLRRLLTGTVLL